MIKFILLLFTSIAIGAAPRDVEFAALKKAFPSHTAGQVTEKSDPLVIECYPAICWTAAFLLLRAQKKGSRPLALTHLAAGFVWIGFLFFVAFQFSRSFRK